MNMFARKNLIFLITGTVWAGWLFLMISGDRWHLFAENWFMSVTMAFGSFIAGATSEGGGAVAFPVMTLLFNIDPSIARDFSLMIQSVGMIAASITIFALGIQVEKRALIFGTIGGATGICLGLTFIAPQVSPPMAKVFFTSLWLSFAFALLLINRYKNRPTVDAIANHNSMSAAALIIAGMAGGMVSSITGSGLDILIFAVLVLYFRVSEKVATPTSVVLMGINALTGFFYKDFALGGMAEAAWDYWYVCVPIVVVGAPLGSYVIKRMHRHSIAWILYISIFTQYIAAILIIPHTTELWIFNIGTFLTGSVIFAVIAKTGAIKKTWLPGHSGP
jgi:uncharacterized membrane protein YfcA